MVKDILKRGLETKSRFEHKSLANIVPCLKKTPHSHMEPYISLPYMLLAWYYERNIEFKHLRTPLSAS